MSVYGEDLMAVVKPSCLYQAVCPNDAIGQQEEVRSLWIAARRENRHLHTISATGGTFGALVPALPAREAREAVLTGRVGRRSRLQALGRKGARVPESRRATNHRPEAQREEP